MVFGTLALFVSSLYFVSFTPTRVNNHKLEIVYDYSETISPYYDNDDIVYSIGCNYNGNQYKFLDVYYFYDNDTNLFTINFGGDEGNIGNWSCYFTLGMYDSYDMDVKYTQSSVAYYYDDTFNTGSLTWRFTEDYDWDDNRNVLYLTFNYLDANVYNFYFGADGVNNNYYNSGYQDGFNTGFDSGYQDGSNSGYSTGYTDGYTTGKTSGYTEGYNVALSTHNFSFTNLFASIGDTPILMIRRLFGFEIFGVSLISAFMSLFTALIVIKIIKKVF